MLEVRSLWISKIKRTKISIQSIIYGSWWIKGLWTCVSCSYIFISYNNTNLPSRILHYLRINRLTCRQSRNDKLVITPFEGLLLAQKDFICFKITLNLLNTKRKKLWKVKKQSKGMYILHELYLTTLISIIFS